MLFLIPQESVLDSQAGCASWQVWDPRASGWGNPLCTPPSLSPGRQEGTKAESRIWWHKLTSHTTHSTHCCKSSGFHFTKQKCSSFYWKEEPYPQWREKAGVKATPTFLPSTTLNCTKGMAFPTLCLWVNPLGNIISFEERKYCTFSPKHLLLFSVLSCSLFLVCQVSRKTA